MPFGPTRPTSLQDAKFYKQPFYMKINVRLCILIENLFNTEIEFNLLCLFRVDGKEFHFEFPFNLEIQGILK